MESDNNSFDAAIRAQYEAVAASGLVVWIGAEPTFTNRQSESPDWLSEALGETKQVFACRIIKEMRDSYPGSIILHPLGTQYAVEPQPCWSLGLHLRRDDRTLANVLPVGPLSEACACEMQDMIAFLRSLAVQPNRNGRVATGLQVDAEMGLRILFTADTRTISIDSAADPCLLRAPVQPHAIPRIRPAKILALSCPQRSENSIFISYNELH